MMTTRQKNPGFIGFIGGGQMAAALIKGVLAAGLYQAEQIMALDPSKQRRELLTKCHGIRCFTDGRALWEQCSLLILAIKPQIMELVLTQHQEHIDEQKHLLISMAAGISLAFIENTLAPKRVKVVRVMPNTPALVLAAASALSPGAYAGDQELRLAADIFAAVGRTVVLPESALDAVTGLSGSGPAYVFTFLEALIDGGIKVGLSREVAGMLARQTILGAMRLVEESDQSPAELRAMVTSPGGTTISGLHTLERGAFRSLVMDAVEAATRRSAELGR